jgi:hypothetical protein
MTSQKTQRCCVVTKAAMPSAILQKKISPVKPSRQFGLAPLAGARQRSKQRPYGQEQYKRPPLKSENVDDQVRPAVEQHDVAADQDVRAIRRRWRQTLLQRDRNRIQTLLQARGKRSVAN